MAQAKKKRKKKKEEAEEDPAFSLGDIIQSETLRGVWGVLLFALATFLLLAAFGFGGFVGEKIFGWLTLLLGVGYALLPFTIFLLAIVLFRSFERHFGALQIGGAIVFFLAGLSLMHIFAEGQGGMVGSLIATPLVAAIDTIASVVFLIAFIITSLLVVFDVHPSSIASSLRSLFGPREDDLENDLEDDIQEIEGMLPEDEEEEYDEEPEEAYEDEEYDEEPERTPQPAAQSDNGGFSIMATPGGIYDPPPLSLLNKNRGKPEVGDIKANANIIKRTLQNFGIQVEMDEVAIGPTVTRYAMKPAEGVRLSRISALQSNIELALAASPIRIEAPIPGKSLVGIEVPNSARITLGLGPVLADPAFVESDKPLLLALGRTITGAPHYADLARMPHLLIAGATGSGKSVMIHNLVVSLLYRCGPEQLRFIMVDPKRVELTLYKSIPHLLTPVITDAKKAILALKWLAKEMERRYDVLETEAVRDISSYHETVYRPALKKVDLEDPESTAKLPEPMPYIVVLIDELADIMQAYPRELESGIVRLAQMSRAVGIHLILSTQRPSVKVITGLIKANVPARIAMQVASQIDSRTILDMGGAEKLLGGGDLLFLSGEMSKPKRMQGAFVTEVEVKKVAKHIAKSYEDALPDEIDFATNNSQNGADAIFSNQESFDDEEEDDLYEEAKDIVVKAGKASTSYLQRKLRVGYARAARLMDMLEERGVIGEADGSKPREVLIGDGARDQEFDEEESEDDERER